jgi:predicted nucleic acid-binding protein
MLIESDLLIPLFKKSDRYRPLSEKILTDIQDDVIKGVYSSTATIQEIVFWLYNRGLYRESIDAVNALSVLKNIEWVPVTPRICINATILIEQYKLSPFDAYHASTALSRDSILLSTDQAYDRINQITRLHPEKLVT